MPKVNINIGHPSHGRGGKTGHQSIEKQARGNKEVNRQEVIKRKQESTRRKFNARAEREIQGIVDKGINEIIPLANRAFANVKKLVHNRRKYALFVLAIDEFVFKKIQKDFEANEFIFPHMGEGFWTPEMRDKYGWLVPSEKAKLFAELLGKKLI